MINQGFQNREQIYDDATSIQRPSYGHQTSATSTHYDANRPPIPEPNRKRNGSVIIKIIRKYPQISILTVANVILVIGLLVAVIVLATKSCPECSQCQTTSTTTTEISTSSIITTLKPHYTTDPVTSTSEITSETTTDLTLNETSTIN